MPPHQEQGKVAAVPQRGFSVGSKAHDGFGQCKPCAFVFKDGKESCRSGTNCKFCHLCEPGEKKRRKKERQAAKKAQEVAKMAPQLMMSYFMRSKTPMMEASMPWNEQLVQCCV